MQTHFNRAVIIVPLLLDVKKNVKIISQKRLHTIKWHLQVPLCKAGFPWGTGKYHKNYVVSHSLSELPDPDKAISCFLLSHLPNLFLKGSYKFSKPSLPQKWGSLYIFGRRKIHREKRF